MKSLTLIIGLLAFSALAAQIRIDDNFSFQTDPAKKYSLLIPPGYTPDEPHRLMLALHPWNTDRWDSESWCDTLIQFGTMNDLILVCPDGGEDGQIDDPIDTAFTSTLLDSVRTWYNIDTEKQYVMGFSWGGKTTYTYGLNHADQFAGFLPIGAAISGTGEIDDVLHLAADKPWYLVHGSQDSPSQRYWPLLEGLEENDAITNSLLMSGVGHTIDFDNRNDILTEAFQWIDSVNCAQITSIDMIDVLSGSQPIPYPNPIEKGKPLMINAVNFHPGEANVAIHPINASSKVYEAKINIGVNDKVLYFPTEDFATGTYILEIQTQEEGIWRYRFIVK